jgi:hypothetical protein
VPTKAIIAGHRRPTAFVLADNLIAAAPPAHKKNQRSCNPKPLHLSRRDPKERRPSKKAE